MIYPCFYGNLAVARQQHACKVTLTWEWQSTGARVAVPLMIWVRTFSRSMCWLCAQVCPDLQSSQKDPHGFGTRFRTVAQARDYRREHMMPPCDKPDYVEPDDPAQHLVAATSVSLLFFPRAATTAPPDLEAPPAPPAVGS